MVIGGPIDDRNTTDAPPLCRRNLLRQEVIFYVYVVKDMFANPHCDDFRGDRKLVGYQEVMGIMAVSGTGKIPRLLKKPLDNYACYLKN